MAKISGVDTLTAYNDVSVTDDVTVSGAVTVGETLGVTGAVTLSSTLTYGGTAITATGAEINYLDISALGTGAASKAVVLDSGDDYTWPATGVLTYGVLKDSAATTITATGAEINYLDIASLGTGAASKAVVLDAGEDYTWPATGVLTYGGTGITATGAEINYLDIAALGTGAASKAVVLDAGEDYTWPATGVLTYGVLKDSAGTTITATGAEINYLDIAALGTGAASKAVVLDAGDDYTWPATGVLTYGVLKDSAATTITATGAEINYLDIAVLGTGAASKAVVLDAGEDYTWPATGVLTYGGTGITATGAEINYLDIAALGTGAASKAVVLDAGEDYTWPATGVLTYGVLKDPAATTLDATALELNRAADVSARLVSVGGTTLAVTLAAHDGRTILLDHSAATSTLTLPAASGSGATFRFVVAAVNTNSHIIQVANASDTIDGSINILDADTQGGGTQSAYQATGTDDTITLNGTTTGGLIGDWIELIDIGTNQWAVWGQLVVPAGSDPGDPFSAAV